MNPFKRSQALSSSRLWFRRSPSRLSLFCKFEVVPTLRARRFPARGPCLLSSLTQAKGRDYICGNELSFREVIMDLGPRARQTQHGERGEEETWELRWGMCVCTQRIYAHTLFGWTSVQMGECWRILLGCWEAGGGVGYPTTRFLQSSKLQSS